ncbi:hypothetical protein HKD37_14G039851 [Glycine soja]
MEMSARMDGADFGSFPTCKSNNVKLATISRFVVITVTSWKFLPGIFGNDRFDIYIACFRKLAPTDAEKREKLEPEKWHTNRGRILAFQRSDFLTFVAESPSKASTFGHHFCSKSRKEGISGVVKCVATSGTSKIQLVLFEFCFAWMLWKLGRIDGDPVLRETRIWATWEYVSSVGEWYLEICRGGQETLGTSGGVLLPKTKLDQSRPNPGIVGQEAKEASSNRLPACVIDYQIVMAAQLTHDRVRWSLGDPRRQHKSLFWGRYNYHVDAMEAAHTTEKGLNKNFYNVCHPMQGSRLWILIETNEIQHLPNNIYRLLLKAVKKHIVKEEKRRRFIEFVTSKFRNNQNLYDCVAIQQKIKLACDYTFLLNSVHHHKDLLFSFNIVVDK